MEQIVEAQAYNQDPKATAPAGTSGNLLVLQSMEQIKEYQNSMKKKKRASGGIGVTNVRKKSKTSGTSKIIDLTDNPTHIAGLEIMELPDHLLTSHQRRSEKKTSKTPNRRTTIAQVDPDNILPGCGEGIPGRPRRKTNSTDKYGIFLSSYCWLTFIHLTYPFFFTQIHLAETTVLPTSNSYETPYTMRTHKPRMTTHQSTKQKPRERMSKIWSVIRDRPPSWHTKDRSPNKDRSLIFCQVKSYPKPNCFNWHHSLRKFIVGGSLIMRSSSSPKARINIPWTQP